jgi:hypothetical protein
VEITILAMTPADATDLASFVGVVISEGTAP